MIFQLAIRTIVGLSVLVTMLVSLPQAKAERPNFVFFLADDISWNDLGCYGHPTIETPRIDTLAATGLRFTNAYLTISSCSPSRCSMITGRYPHNTGAPELHTRLPDDQLCFPTLLREAGYYTVLSGKNHMGPAVQTAFSKISRGRGPGREGDWVELLEKRPADKPFFCWFASVDAHRSWQFNDDAPRYSPDDVVVPPYLVDGPKTREDLTGYYHEVSRFDHYVGKVVDELKKQGVLKNTMIVVMADNGRPFPRCKTRLYDSGIKTPFVVHFPSRAEAGVTSSLVSAVDLAPTFLELAGLEQPASIQGVSFTPILEDPKAVVRDVAFAEHNWHVYKNHERMVRCGDWLYIRNNFADQQNLCAEAYIGGAGQELWQAAEDGELTGPQKNLFRNPCPEEELYNVIDDPTQLHNLASSEETRKVMRRMRGLLRQWTEQTGDTVPKDPTPHRDSPPGAPRKSRQGFKHREMPGDARDARKINQPGPVLLDD